MPRFKCGEVMKPIPTAEFGAEVAGENERNERIATKPRKSLLDLMQEFGRPRTSRMSSSKISVLGQRMNTSASTRIFSVALISKERRGVDLQGHSDAQVR
ncbi:hypothetical protein PIB30_004998 [Stylosanthes scabra]|uniref:Uncharacterized protein n=1 Tax=Stylosanthes scabra TaxID=79078 RepID=A0ABU6Y2G3_9FABA|nr:hypothetical protein [Stylosanthes scabra]